MKQRITEQLDIFADYIRRKGLRMTRQREMIVLTFLENEGHLSTDELFDLVRRQDQKIGYATVSRTLKALIDCGLARETDLNDGRVRFEHLYKHPHHYHIICTECNRTIEFFNPEIDRIQMQILEEYGFEPDRHRFQIFGICPACRNPQRESGTQTYHSDQVFARDALKIAMETERRGMRFYQTASKIVAQPATRATFLKMLEDEKKHLSRLKKEWNRLIRSNRGILEAPVFLHFDFEALKQIFPSREEINRKMAVDLTEEEALNLAMKMELDAFHFFRKYAEKFSDSKGRDIFLQFADEENEHYEIMKSALHDLRERKKSN